VCYFKISRCAKRVAVFPDPLAGLTEGQGGKWTIREDEEGRGNGRGGEAYASKVKKAPHVADNSISVTVCYRTKFIGGHEDVCAGVLTTRTSQQWKRIMHARQLFGGILVRYVAVICQFR